MEITLEKKDPTTATIKVNLKEADYTPKVAEKVKEYSKKVSLKGFRPGKVPSGLIEKMYGKGIKIEEINTLLARSVTDYIKDNKLAILGEPLPDRENASKIDWDNQKEFEFNYAIGLVPEFKVDLSDKVKINKYEIGIDDKTVKETVENLKSQYGKSINPEESLEGDFLQGEIKEVKGDFTASTLIPTNKINKKELSKFIGLKKGDKVEFDIKKTFEDAAAIAHATGLTKEEAETKEGIFEFTVTNISRSEPAILDQEFFDKIFGKDTIKTEEEFNEKLKTTIQENYTKEAENLLSRDIQNQLVENTKIELPNAFLKQWLLVSNEGKITAEQIEKDYEFYMKELKWSLIKNKIGEENSIKVDNEEVVNKTKEMISQQFGNLPMNDEMAETFNKIADNYLQQEQGKNYQKLYEEVFYQKVLAAIKSKVSFQDKKIDVEEFKKLLGY